MFPIQTGAVISPCEQTRREFLRRGVAAGLCGWTTAFGPSRGISAADGQQPTDVDRQFFERELQAFVPDKVFDAHAHLYQRDTMVDPKGLPPEVGYRDYIALMQELLPRRRIAAMFLPVFNADKKELIPQCNDWIGKQVAETKDCVGEYFIRPQDDPAVVLREMKRLKLRGFKCYHTMAARPSTWDAEIPDYLPERLVELANQERWFITLHLVRARAVADEGNQRWIEHYCRKYPNMTLILAHSARGFQPAHNLEGLHVLKGLENLYFDTSANCEPIAHQAIMRIMGHEKLLYGSDFYVSHLRGRSVAAADSFIWLYEQTPVWKEKQATISPVLIGLENLRSLKWACWSERLGDAQVEDIFWNNAAKLFGIR